MLLIDNFIQQFFTFFPTQKYILPWELTKNLSDFLLELIPGLSSDYSVINNVAIHETAVIENTAILKAPVIIGKNCFVGANAYLRGGVYLIESVVIGTSCEIKSSIIFPHSAVAHFNFIGDSILGSNVNFEAGSITANHHNDRLDKQITVVYNATHLQTDTEKFGALVGDNSKIGANAVLSPGTLLPPNSIVRRLELVEQK
ncbi:DapH/DapD/GlmU-related protein [Adhaeribacter radiodurans]|uniref:LpxA family transferase n=1 Tax=Adhaeribacter radiodurans TaxID=2745197 RepID=A0A7L7L9X7_9BACT|nr:DapH/DapD/GlmU-related protein [Adhaeribacter radiodurans]QMU29345.1 LpxA family transferase [Adhaeribacter radiodurans]